MEIKAYLFDKEKLEDQIKKSPDIEKTLIDEGIIPEEQYLLLNTGKRFNDLPEEEKNTLSEAMINLMTICGGVLLSLASIKLILRDNQSNRIYSMTYKKFHSMIIALRKEYLKALKKQKSTKSQSL